MKTVPAMITPPNSVSSRLTLFCALTLMLATHAIAQDVFRNPKTDLKLLGKFQDAKLGLFVHWMACHSPGTGDSWAIGNGKSKELADALCTSWNPVNFDAHKIVSTAKTLGCKYMVVISKHHDGFAIWPTKFTSFNVTKTPFKKDILGELSKECKKQGLLFGIYYSIADIDYCGWERMPSAYSKDLVMPKKGKEDFIEFNKNQVKELIQNYDPDILWFDGFWLDPVLWTSKEGREFYDYVKSLKWSILTTRNAITLDPNNSKAEGFVTNGAAGDFFGVEARTQVAPSYPWEGCTSVSYPAYAYEPGATLHTASELINLFDRTICGNGNFLLNIGPKRTGELPGELVKRFSEMTDWVRPNAEAIYGTRGGPFIQGDWGGSTYKGSNLYLHIRKGETELKLPIHGYQVKSVSDVRTKQSVRFERLSEFDVLIHVPKFGAGRDIPILRVELDKTYKFSSWLSL